MTMIHLQGTVAPIVLALFTSSPVVAGVPGNADSENPSAEITITDVSAEWTHRSDAANTIRVSWKQTLTLRRAVPQLGMCRVLFCDRMKANPVRGYGSTRRVSSFCCVKQYHQGELREYKQTSGIQAAPIKLTGCRPDGKL